MTDVVSAKEKNLITASAARKNTRAAYKLIDSLNTDIIKASKYGRNSIVYDFTRVDPVVCQKIMINIIANGFTAKQIGDDDCFEISW